jgi:TRAP-type C4-dicarboxylate transport system substrate-binding protein
MRKLIHAATATLLALGLALGANQAHAGATYELNIGSLAPKGTPWMTLLEQMEKDIEGGSNGQINVIIRPPGVMSEVEMVRETRRGERLQAAAVTTAALAEGGNMPLLQLVELPYLFNDNAEADYVMDNVLWEAYGDLLKRRGFVLAVWSENGWRSFGTKGSPIRVPADLKKFKMRSQESDVHMAMYKAFGGQAVQKPMTEVLTSLQSNVVDGLDNTALYIQSGGLAEPLDYFTLSRHIYQPAAIVYSRSFIESLPEDLQKLCMSVKRLTQDGRNAIRAEEAAMMENFEIFDVEVIELSVAERAAFADIARGIHADFAATVDGGPELLKKMNDGVKAFQAK